MKVLKDKCEYCGKELESLYPAQLESQLMTHLVYCEERRKHEREGK